MPPNTSRMSTGPYGTPLVIWVAGGVALGLFGLFLFVALVQFFRVGAVRQSAAYILAVQILVTTFSTILTAAYVFGRVGAEVAAAVVLFFVSIGNNPLRLLTIGALLTIGVYTIYNEEAVITALKVGGDCYTGRLGRLIFTVFVTPVAFLYENLVPLYNVAIRFILEDLYMTLGCIFSVGTGDIEGGDPPCEYNFARNVAMGPGGWDEALAYPAPTAAHILQLNGLSPRVDIGPLTVIRDVINEVFDFFYTVGAVGGAEAAGATGIFAPFLTFFINTVWRGVTFLYTVYTLQACSWTEFWQLFFGFTQAEVLGSGGTLSNPGGALIIPTLQELRNLIPSSNDLTEIFRDVLGCGIDVLPPFRNVISGTALTPAGVFSVISAIVTSIICFADAISVGVFDLLFGLLQLVLGPVYGLIRPLIPLIESIVDLITCPAALLRSFARMIRRTKFRSAFRRITRLVSECLVRRPVAVIRRLNDLAEESLSIISRDVDHDPNAMHCGQDGICEGEEFHPDSIEARHEKKWVQWEIAYTQFEEYKQQRKERGIGSENATLLQRGIELGLPSQDDLNDAVRSYTRDVLYDMGIKPTDSSCAETMHSGSPFLLTPGLDGHLELTSNGLTTLSWFGCAMLLRVSGIGRRAHESVMQSHHAMRSETTARLVSDYSQYKPSHFMGARWWEAAGAASDMIALDRRSKRLAPLIAGGHIDRDEHAELLHNPVVTMGDMAHFVTEMSGASWNVHSGREDMPRVIQDLWDRAENGTARALMFEHYVPGRNSAPPPPDDPEPLNSPWQKRKPPASEMLKRISASIQLTVGRITHSGLQYHPVTQQALLTARNMLGEGASRLEDYMTPATRGGIGKKRHAAHLRWVDRDEDSLPQQALRLRQMTNAAAKKKKEVPDPNEAFRWSDRRDPINHRAGRQGGPQDDTPQSLAMQQYVDNNPIIDMYEFLDDVTNELLGERWITTLRELAEGIVLIDVWDEIIDFAVSSVDCQYPEDVNGEDGNPYKLSCLVYGQIPEFVFDDVDQVRDTLFPLVSPIPPASIEAAREPTDCRVNGEIAELEIKTCAEWGWSSFLNPLLFPLANVPALYNNIVENENRNALWVLFSLVFFYRLAITDEASDSTVGTLATTAQSLIFVVGDFYIYRVSSIEALAGVLGVPLFYSLSWAAFVRTFLNDITFPLATFSPVAWIKDFPFGYDLPIFGTFLDGVARFTLGFSRLGDWDFLSRTVDVMDYPLQGYDFTPTQHHYCFFARVDAMAQLLAIVFLIPLVGRTSFAALSAAPAFVSNLFNSAATLLVALQASETAREMAEQEEMVEQNEERVDDLERRVAIVEGARQ